MISELAKERAICERRELKWKGDEYRPKRGYMLPHMYSQALPPKG
jgi:hypothetical protein